jgi:hypothetical protein
MGMDDSLRRSPEEMNCLSCSFGDTVAPEDGGAVSLRSEWGEPLPSLPSYNTVPKGLCMALGRVKLRTVGEPGQAGRVQEQPGWAVGS